MAINKYLIYILVIIIHNLKRLNFILKIKIFNYNHKKYKHLNFIIQLLSLHQLYFIKLYKNIRMSILFYEREMLTSFEQGWLTN